MCCTAKSLSSRRAWIEIEDGISRKQSEWCRSPHGERGLKSSAAAYDASVIGRSPHGERGLK